MAELFPTFEVPTIVDAPETDEEIYKESAYFDFETGDFALDGAGRIKLANGFEAWRQWCVKTCYTQRGAFAAYTDGLGIEADEAFSESDRLLQQAYLERTIKEALMADPYGRTEDVSGFVWTVRGDSLYMTCTITGKNDKTAQISVNISDSATIAHVGG